MQRRGGFALVLILGLVAIAGALAASSLHEALFGQALAGTRQWQQRASSVADIGMAGALARLAATPPPADYSRELQPLAPAPDSVVITQRSLGLLEKELAVAEGMSAKGLMSEVEVMRVRRQVNDLNLQVQERLNRHRQDASVELARLRTELAQLDENQVVRDDAVKRTTLVSPVNGLVKQIRTHTVGGVVGGGAPLMEIVPVGDKVLVEMRVKPADIGFLRVGQAAEVKLSAYEFTVYGSLSGKVVTISPDALGDPERAQATDGTWYRALVEADRSTLQAGGKPLVAIPGMTGTAEVNVGERTVLSYLLRPMLKAREAFQER